MAKQRFGKIRDAKPLPHLKRDYGIKRNNARRHVCAKGLLSVQWLTPDRTHCEGIALVSFFTEA
jgi:hypothetical protein